MIEKSDIKQIFSELQWIKDEEQTREKPMRKMFSIECEYTGPEEKNRP